MKILKAERQNNTYFLEIEESNENIQKTMTNVFQRLSKTVQIPGFRKGKISRSIFEKNFGREYLVEETLKDVVGAAYFQAIKELGLYIIDQPRNLKMEEYKEEAPLQFSCEVDVKPEVKLGQYKDLSIPKEETRVAEDKVQEQINMLRERQAQFVVVEKESALDDMLKVDVQAFIDGQSYPTWTRENTAVMLGRNLFGKEADEKMLGMRVGEERTFSIAYPADAPNKDVAGKTVELRILLHEIKEKKLPEFNDEFAQKAMGVATSTAAELESSIRKHLQDAREQDVDNKFRHELLERIMENTEVEIQQALIDNELEQAQKRFAKKLLSSGMTRANFLLYTNKTEEGLLQEFTVEAKRHIKQELVLEKIVEQENIQVTEEDMYAEIKKWQMPKVQSEAEIKQYLTGVNIENLKFLIGQQKAMEFLIQNTKVIAA